MTHYSRSTWAQIIKRVKQAGFKFTRTAKCFVCGRNLLGANCPHTFEENETVLAKVLEELSPVG